jgi:GMP synthase (glutamine-hydrolysing)
VHPSEHVLIVDYGSQYTQLIARRIREHHVYCEVVPPWVETAQVEKSGPGALVLSGGPGSVAEAGAPPLNEDLLDLGIPVLGICYGQQLLVSHFGGTVEPAREREYGRATLRLAEGSDPLFEGVPRESVVWMSHGDRVVRVPEGFRVLGTSDNSPFAAIRQDSRPVYGLQFHPEVFHTEAGERILGNFLRNVAALEGTWTLEAFIETELRELGERIGTDRVICGVSGGVDSTVVAALLHRAVGEQLRCILIDNGLLRSHEAEEVVRTFEEVLRIPIELVDASSLFLERLRGIEDPEKKRVVIGHTFIEVFESTARRTSDARFLAQGTLYPDVIESISVWGPSATIKTHHNVGGLPERMHLDLVEPLRDLFKDEVREVGRKLGIPEPALIRHPFPGPGLAIRIVGEVTPERLEILRQADRVVVEEIERAGLYEGMWQAFAVFLPVRSVGVMGDARTYDHVIAVRCVTSRDAMTADWASVPSEVLGRISSRIINEVEGVNRVVYDISSKPPATIEWE